MVYGTRIFFFIAFTFFYSSAVWADKSIAMVTDLEGSVLMGDTPETLRPVEILDSFPKGTRLYLEEGGRLKLCFYHTATVFKATGNGVVLLEANGIKNEDGAVKISQKSVSMIAETGLKPNDSFVQGGLILRSGLKEDPPLDLIYPVETIILEQVPELRWKTKGSATVQVKMYSQEGETVLDKEVGSNKLRLSETEKLEPGHIYMWDVRVTEGSGKGLNEAASFLVANENLARQVIKHKPSQGASFSARVLFGQFLEEQGLVQEAQKIWRDLSKERPKSRRLKSLLEKTL